MTATQIETERQRAARIAKWRLIETVPCPRCGAPAGQQCPTTRNSNSTPPHAARRGDRGALSAVSPPLLCRHCSGEIRRCGCHQNGCGTPGWRHWPSLFHRCGGDGPAFAEPELGRSPEALRSAVDQAHRDTADQWRRKADAADAAGLLAREQADRRWLAALPNQMRRIGPRT